MIVYPTKAYVVRKNIKKYDRWCVLYVDIITLVYTLLNAVQPYDDDMEYNNKKYISAQIQTNKVMLVGKRYYKIENNNKCFIKMREREVGDHPKQKNI